MMSIKTLFRVFFLAGILFLHGGVLTASAQENAEATQVKNKEVDASEIPSLLFTYWEHTAIMDAKKDALRQAGIRRNVTDDELQRELNKSNKPAEPKPKPPPEMRELRLGGIAYTDQDDWTIWLNEQRITPNALPEEIIDLRVRRHHIEVKWYDDYTAQIFPIKLKPHQRFNLDSRIFLPG
ncbi:MAG: hypothetical protein ACLFR0_01160 [Alphaproteobacteria bacterium]